VGYGSDFAATTFTVVSGISPGIQFKFQVRAKNMWGWGPFSTVLPVTPSAKPDQMPTVVTTNDDQSGDVVMTWVIPSDNSSPITSYKIEFLDANALVWSQLTTHCDGTNSAIMVAHQCTIPMAKFTATPLSLSLSDLIVVRASAYNANGWSTVSTSNTVGAKVRTIATTMHAPVRDASSSDTQIVLTWSTLTGDAGTGGATILSYGLEWDAGTTGGAGGQVWSYLSGHTVRSLTTTFTISSGLTAGQAYLFRLKAENVYGWGPASTQTTVYAAGLPSQPSTVTTTVMGTDVRIQFSPPSNIAAPILMYKIIIKQSDGQFTETATHCDGSSTAVKTNYYCDVAITVLRASSYSLVYGNLVQARVQAKNANGWGNLSQVNLGGATI
jgi:hypothetical protein